MIQRSTIFNAAHSKDLWSLDTHTQKKPLSWSRLLQKKLLHLEVSMKSQFPGCRVVRITACWPLYQGQLCGTLSNKLPHSLPEALILQARILRGFSPPSLQDGHNNHGRARKWRTTWPRANFTQLLWKGTITVKYLFVWRAPHRNETRTIEATLNIQIYSNVSLIIIHIFTYLNILACTKRVWYVYLLLRRRQCTLLHSVVVGWPGILQPLGSIARTCLPAPARRFGAIERRRKEMHI